MKFGRCRRLRCSRFRRPRRRCVGTVAIRVLPHCEPAWAFRIRSPGQQPRILSFCFLCSSPLLSPPQFTKQNPHRSSHPASPALSANASPPSSRNYFPILRNRIPFAVVLPLSFSLFLSLFSFYLSTNPYAHPFPLYSSSLRFHSTHNFIHLTVTATTFVPSLFHLNRLIVFVSLTQPRIVNHRDPSFLRRTHARIHTYPIDQTLSSLFFKLFLPPFVVNCSFHRDQHTLSFCFIIS